MSELVTTKAEESKIAFILGLSPTHKESWPMELIGLLARYEKKSTREEFQMACVYAARLCQ